MKTLVLTDKQIKKLTQDYSVWEEDAKGNVKLVLPNLGELIYDGLDLHFLTTEDNHEIYHYNGGYYEANGIPSIKSLVEQILKKGTQEHYKNEVLGYIRDKNYQERDIFNTNLNLINLQNGVYNLKTKKFTEHKPENYFLSELPIIYDPNATIDKIQNFFEVLLYLNDITVLQEFFGDCLQRTYRYKKALMNVGPTNTGKSKLLKLLELFLGKHNIANASLHDLCKDKYAPVELYSKYANICADIGSSSLRQVSKFLMLTGGDRIRAQRKYGQPFNFENFAKLVFSCNIIPDTEVKTDAFYGRWVVLEYTNIIPEEEQDAKIIEKIATEQELSGLFNWAIQGLNRLEKNGRYSKHRSLEEVKEFMQKGHNPIKEFVETYITSKTDGVRIKKHVYQCYKAFCTIHNYPVVESNVFSRKFSQLAPDSLSDGQIRKGGRVWKGIECNYDLAEGQQKAIEECM